MNIEGIEIEFLGHASFIINNNIFIDPYNIETDKKADLILITHSHYDHCSLEDIQKIMKPETIVIGPPDCSSKFSRIEGLKTKIITPGKKFTSNNLIIEAVPAYSTKKPYHPKENEWVGYIITINNKKIYHAGDTELIPEMNNLNVDIALLPIGGTYTMNVQEAVQAVSKIKTKIAIPMHFGNKAKVQLGSPDCTQEFKESVKDAQVIILEEK